MSSSDADLFRPVFPHLSHLWVIIKPFFESGWAETGRITPPQSDALSPGFMSR